MTDRLKIALVQANPVVGDITGNMLKARVWRAQAEAAGADLVVFTELFVVGYPPEDLVLKRAFQNEVREAVEAFAAETASGPAVLIGAPWSKDGRLHNAVLLLDGGAVQAARFKVDLPNYGVFDEKRVFAPGEMPEPIVVRGVRIGAPICEDVWTGAIVGYLAEAGAEIMVAPNGSPFERAKFDRRMELVEARVRESGLPFVYVNQVGGQDELVFDGGSFVLNADGALALQMPTFVEGMETTEWTRGPAGWRCAAGARAPAEDEPSAIYQAMMLGLRDYVNKNRFPGVVLGLSGGVDSALSAAVAVDALGAERVRCVMMPSRYTGEESLGDAAECARLLGVRYDIVSISPTVAAFEDALTQTFAGRPPDTTEENIQSRTRGVMLMAISNKFGPMVLTTGNKSEMSVGYATLYGDMCGGYNVLKDVYKTEVFALSRWRNANRPRGALGPDGAVMPENVIVKPPTAELRENQTDQDSLPPYEALDDILEGLVEDELSVAEVVARGHDPAVVKRIEHLLYIAEYKRRQAPPGVKIGRRNFGRDRRYPITNGFRDAR